MNIKIMDFVDSSLLTTQQQKENIVNILIDWSNDYKSRPLETKIQILVNEILPVYFSNELAQKFLDMYFNNVLVSKYKK